MTAPIHTARITGVIFCVFQASEGKTRAFSCRMSGGLAHTL